MLDVDDEASPLYDAYDGRLRAYLPDDLYLIGSTEALTKLRGAIDRALRGGMGAAGGLHSDQRQRRVVVMLMEPAEGKLAPELISVETAPQPATLVTLFNRAAPPVEVEA